MNIAREKLNAEVKLLSKSKEVSGFSSFDQVKEQLEIQRKQIQELQRNVDKKNTILKRIASRFGIEEIESLESAIGEFQQSYRDMVNELQTIQLKNNTLESDYAISQKVGDRSIVLNIEYFRNAKKLACKRRRAEKSI